MTNIGGYVLPFDLIGFLDEPRRLAQVAAVSPRRNPLLGSLWFVFTEGRFWFSSHPDNALAVAAARSEQVAVIVDLFDPPQRIWQVRVRGQSAVEVHDPARVRSIYSRYLGTEVTAWPPDMVTRVDDDGWVLWSVGADSGVVGANPGFVPHEYRWSGRKGSPFGTALLPDREDFEGQS